MKKNRVVRLVCQGVSLLAATSVFAAPSIDLSVGMDPAGSFIAHSGDLKGRVVKKGADLSAEGVWLNLASLSSGIELRDKHMKEKYLETDKNPVAYLKSVTGKDGSFNAVLNYRHKDAAVNGTYEFTAKGDEVIVRFTTKMSDYDVAPPSYMGVGVEDEMKVEVHLPLESPARAG